MEIVQTLYNGKVTVKFLGPTEDKPWRHMYFVNGKRATGVTTYIGIKDKSRPLGIWQQQITADFLLSKIEQGEKINEDLALEAAVQNDVKREEAADIGSEIHDWCERYIKNKIGLPGYEDLPDIPNFPEAITGVNSFLEWEKKHKVKFLSSERIVYSKKHGYIGTMDLEAVIDGKYCNGCDFKSSNGLYNTVRMQTAAYEQADREERKCKRTEARWAVRFSKHTAEEYYRKEERKKEVKKAIARIKGREFKDYEIPEYQVFEARMLDDKRTDLNSDFEAFLCCKKLTEWDRATDFWTLDRAAK